MARSDELDSPALPALTARLNALSPERRALLERRLAQRRVDLAPAPTRHGVDEAPLSNAQQRLWVNERVGRHGDAYHCPFVLRFEGRLNRAALQDAYQEVVRRHEILRSQVQTRGAEVRQRVVAVHPVALPLVDLTLLQVERDAAAHLFATEERHAFHPAEGSLVRVLLAREGDHSHLVFADFHHMVTDARSMELFLAEFAALYNANLGGLPSPLSEPPLQYSDYALWEHARARLSSSRDALAYWLEHLAGLPDLELAADYGTPPKGARAGVVQAAVSRATTARLRALATDTSASLFMVMLSAFQALLYRFTGREDFGIGIPASHRDRPELDRVMGLFVHTLVMRTPIAGGDPFSQLVQRNRAVVFEAFAHSEVPFDAVVTALRPGAGHARSPLFQVMFNYLHTPAELPVFTNLKLSANTLEAHDAKYELTVCVVDKGTTLGIVWEYDGGRYAPRTVETLSALFLELLDGVARAPSARLDELAMRGEGGRHGAQRADPPETFAALSLVDLWLQVVAARPDTLALVAPGDALADGSHADVHLTYSELARRVDTLAAALRRRGIGPECIVGVHATRSPEAIVAMLATLRAGAAFLPLDRSYPAERLGFMAQDADVALVMLGSGIERPSWAAAWACERISELCGEEPPRFDDPPFPPVFADQSAYVIYTSGSTGRPKGVIGTHRGAVNRFRWMWREYPFVAGELCCHRTSLGFVDSVWEIFGPLLQGVAAFIVPDASLSRPAQMLGELCARQVTRIVLVPTLLRALLAASGELRVPSLCTWVSSGEALPTELCEHFRERMGSEARLLNLYGSSEVAADVTCFASCGSHAQGPIPIGLPIDNTAVWVVDRCMRPLPLCAAGALLVGGHGLARGYRGDPALTAERFVPVPNGRVARPIAEGARCYRTGDRARVLPDGNVEYLGREDWQMKISGFRIEPSEIERELVELPDVRSACVVLSGSSERPTLVGYLVHGAAQRPRRAPAELALRLRERLKEKLPPLMIPAEFVLLPQLPLTPSGKVDRRQLACLSIEPEPEATPPNALERRIIELVARVAMAEGVQTNSRVLALGLNSLQLIQLHAELQASFPQMVSVQALFDNPSIRELAANLGPESSAVESENSPMVVEI